MRVKSRARRARRRKKDECDGVSTRNPTPSRECEGGEKKRGQKKGDRRGIIPVGCAEEKGGGIS